MSISCLRHWFLHLAPLHSNSWMFQYGCLYCHMSKKLIPGSMMREQMSLILRRQTSSLVFIFIFYISLNVQRVSCSIVKYLYIHMYLSWLIYLGPQIVLSKLFINHWMQLLCFFGTQLMAICLFILLIMYWEFYLLKMSYRCLYLCTHIYI